jgi:hypothetical protein
MRHWWTIPAAAFLFILPALACGSATPTSRAGGGAQAKPTDTPKPAPTATAVPQTYDLNQLVSVKNWDVAVGGVERPGKMLTWSQFGNVSNAAGTWVIVLCDLKNTGSQNFGVNTPDFQLLDGKGNKYNVSSDMGAIGYSQYKGGQAIGGQVPPGVSVRYYVPFDVAPDATGLRFIFNQDKKPAFDIGNAAQ